MHTIENTRVTQVRLLARKQTIMINLSKVGRNCLPFQSTVGCGGIVGLFEQLNLIRDVEFMTGLLRYTYFNPPQSTATCGGIAGSFKQLNPIGPIEFMIGLLRYAYSDQSYSGPKNNDSEEVEIAL